MVRVGRRGNAITWGSLKVLALHSGIISPMIDAVSTNLGILNETMAIFFRDLYQRI